jgi:hypothetical protein
MGRKNLVLLSISILCFFSCTKDTNSPQALIVGKWTLHQQHVLLTIDNITKIDTIFTASGTAYATAQFNNDGTFSSASAYRPDNTSLSTWPGPTSGNTTGTYSYSGSVFTIVPGLSGWFSFGVGISSPPTDVSSSIRIAQLDHSSLTVHDTNAFTLTIGSASHTYSEVDEYYYNK